MRSLAILPERNFPRSVIRAALDARAEAPCVGVMEMSGFDHNEILTPDELAGRLKVPPSWIYETTRGRARDHLPVVRVGRYLRFYWPDVVFWLDRHRTKSLEEVRP
jgi:hypothetical protein